MTRNGTAVTFLESTCSLKGCNAADEGYHSPSAYCKDMPGGSRYQLL